MIQSRALLRFRAAASNARAPRRAQSTAATPPPLAGTVGEHHTLVLLHTSTPITALAAKPTTAAALTRVLGPGYGVQLAWAPRDEPAPSVLRARSADDAGEGESEAPRVHALSVFRPGAPVLHAPLPAGPAVDAAAVQALLANPDDAAQNAADAPAHYLYVCTHGTRDCRCGETGGAVVAALRAARARFAEGAKTEEERELWAKKVHIGEVAHVGGHKYAANVLCYPSGDWLGNATPSDASAILQAVVSDPASLVRGVGGAQWRGRMGLDKQAQLAAAGVSEGETK